MTKQPTRLTVDGRAYLGLQRLARETGKLTGELLQMYALEGFLARLSASAYASQLVLKGGVLLAAYDLRRPTRDIDLQATRLDNSVDEVRGMISKIASLPRGDGIEFDPEQLHAEMIREEDVYSGVRVSLDARLATARLPFHVDVNVGDPIWPSPRRVVLPALLGGEPVSLLGYPTHMVLAEKIVTAIQRGQANTRWRDFADIYQLIRLHDIAYKDLRLSCVEVARYRATTISALAKVLTGFGELAQGRWAAWVRKNRREEAVPVQFSQVVMAICAFADPALIGDLSSEHVWSHRELHWGTAGTLAGR